MTEDEAKTKWCPFARAPAGSSGTVHTGAPVGNRTTMGKLDGACLCVGPACMAWREMPVHDTRARELWSKKKGERVSSAYGADAEWRLVNPDEPQPAREGFCGLAGQP